MMQLFPPNLKITIAKHNIKKERVLSLVNAGWIVSRMLYIFFNVSQINQLYLSNTEASPHYIYANDTHSEKLFDSIQYKNLIEIEAWLRQTFFIY